jgi:mycofactocin system FadH/OYE family oxidoreductase 2
MEILEMYDRLFQPLKIGQREARNRILFGSHTTNFARHNLLSSLHADYYAARAEGGAGMIVLEEHIVHDSDMPYESAVLGFLPGTAQAEKAVIERIHEHGSLALVQLNHNGQQSTSGHHQREMWAPSPVPDVSSRETPKEMEYADIRAVIDGFAQVAHTVTQAGADGVELQVADSSLLRQFLSPLTNQRSDAYGGELENRLRFVQETLEAVVAAIGTDRVLGVRFCADELAPWAGLTPEQSLEIVRLLKTSSRIDYVTVTMGSILSTHMFPFHASMHVPQNYSAHLAGAIKAAIDIPVFASGRIMSAAQAERILAEEQADGVEMIRALIADPNLPRLSQEGHHRRVRPCISCNQGCQVRGVMNATISCSVNPDVLHTQPLPSELPIVEKRKKEFFEDTSNPGKGHSPLHSQRVYIVGGGPAGLEAARTAALRGREVVLYEREAILGGTVALAAKGPGRGELQLITDYLVSELERLGVEVHTGVEVTAEMLRGVYPERSEWTQHDNFPDTIIIATGAYTGSGLLPIPGHDLPHTTDIRRVLAGVPVEGQRVVVVDETDSHGVLSVVELLASAGKKVEVVTEDFYAGRDLVATHDLVLWKQRVLPHGIVVTPHTTVVRIEPGKVIVVDRFAEGERELLADSIVLGTYERPSQELYMALKDHIPRLFRIGDCVAPRRIEQAILEGRRVGEWL